MLIPRFSIRWMMAIMVVFALIFVVAKFAMTGSIWALSILAAVFAGVILMVIFALMFLAVSLVVKVLPVRSRTKTESPFAADRLPPQVIPSRDAEAR